MTAVIARTALVPVLGRPTLRAEQVTQLVLGETARVENVAGEWRRIVTDFDGYQGWVHGGYCVDVSASDAAIWRRAATGWSDGATLALADGELRVPLRARLAILGDGRVRLPDDRTGRVLHGSVGSALDAAAEARTLPAPEGASERFDGAPYLWGGVTPWGVDCSGLVQTTFAARGVVLPRDAIQQAECGAPVPLDEVVAGDLLFFRSDAGQRITHVAFAGPAETLVHSTVARGGVVVEPRAGPAAQKLLRRFVTARRIGSSP